MTVNARLIAEAVILAGLVLALRHIWILERWRRRVDAECGRRKMPLPPVKLEELHPMFRHNGLGPSVDSEAVIVGGLVLGGVTDFESWILAALSKNALSMFEFGTATGRTAYIWARNSPPQARITTLTLLAGQTADYRHEATDDRTAHLNALEESRAETDFYYSGTPMAAKITQLFGDSKAFDEQPFAGQCDLIFVDGSHAYSYVVSDTAKAMKMLRPGGLILWHDYLPFDSELEGVYTYLNELGRTLPVRRIPGTRFVVYRSPAATA